MEHGRKNQEPIPLDEGGAKATYDATVAKYKEAAPDKATIDTWLSRFGDGKFGDIAYPPPTNVPDSGVEKLTEHLQRLLSIACFVLEYDDGDRDRYSASVVTGLNFYAASNYTTANWWFRSIGLAKLGARAALVVAQFVRGDNSLASFYLPDAAETTNTDADMAGGNLADYASIQLCWCLAGWINTNDVKYLEYLDSVSRTLARLCFPVTRHGGTAKDVGEGISVDYSFSAHNLNKGAISQLALCSYGPEMFGRVTEGMSTLKGSFTVAEEAYGELTRFMLDGVGWAAYAGMVDFHPQGRGSSRGVVSPVPWAGSIDILLEHGANAGLTELRDRFISGSEANNVTFRGNRGYWVNDYMAHFGTELALWTRAASKRTTAIESGNGENLKGYYMGNGTCFVTRTGEEFKGIQPVWDWQRLPGCTAEQVPDFKFPLVDWGFGAEGTHDFAGVVSDGIRGITSMIRNRRNVHEARTTVFAEGNQAWFAGSCIDVTKAANPVVTSVAQQLFVSPGARVFLRSGKWVDIEGPGHMRFSGDRAAKAVVHNGLRYSFPDDLEQSVTVAVIEQEGRWSDIRRGSSDELLKKMVFSIWLEHGKSVRERYVYSVAPDGEAASGSVEWSDDAHVVVSPARDRCLTTIYVPGPDGIALKDGISIRATEQSSFAIAVDDGRLALTCADLTQKKGSLTFEIHWPSSVQPSIETVVLPGEDDAGRSVTVYIDRPRS